MERRDVRRANLFGRLAPGVDAQAGADGADRHLQEPRAAVSRHEQVDGRRGHDLQSAIQRRSDPRRVSRADGSRRVRAAHRVRERRQPAARAIGAAIARDRACASRSAPAAGASSVSCLSRARCSPFSAASSAGSVARRCSSSSTWRSPTSASRTGSSSRWMRPSSPFWSPCASRLGSSSGSSRPFRSRRPISTKS